MFHLLTCMSECRRHWRFNFSDISSLFSWNYIASLYKLNFFYSLLELTEINDSLEGRKNILKMYHSSSTFLKIVASNVTLVWVVFIGFKHGRPPLWSLNQSVGICSSLKQLLLWNRHVSCPLIVVIAPQVNKVREWKHLMR